MVPLPARECDKYKVYAEHMEKQKLMQFLMGLNDNFAQSRSQIPMTVPSPSLNQAYNLIMQDESQKVQSSLISNCVLAVQKLNILETTTTATALASLQNNKFKPKAGGLYCDYCHLKNHTKANCYKLIGYPLNYKFQKKRGVNNRSFRGHNFENDRILECIE